MKFMLRVAVAALASLGAGLAVAAIDPATLIKLSSSVLQVEVIRTQGGYSLGSGVVVGADRVATNCHVTRDAKQIAVVQGGLRLPAEAQRVDANHDLCLLHIPGVDAWRTVVFGQAAQLAIGQPLIAVGHTAGALQSSLGEVLSLHRLDSGRVVQVSNYFNSGASGGGLFDADSRLVGILTFRLRGGMAHYFAMPAEWLERQLVDVEHHEQPIAPRASTELAFWERPLDAQPFFLRAAVLENNGDWSALEPLATDWLLHDGTDPEPWYLLGEALSRQDRPREARGALSCSLALQPDFRNARAEFVRLPLSPDPSADATARPCHL